MVFYFVCEFVPYLIGAADGAQKQLDASQSRDNAGYNVIHNLFVNNKFHVSRRMRSMDKGKKANNKKINEKKNYGAFNADVNKMNKLLWRKTDLWLRISSFLKNFKRQWISTHKERVALFDTVVHMSDKIYTLFFVSIKEQLHVNQHFYDN